MVSAPPPARRLAALGCALVAALTLTSSGCGEGGTAAAGYGSSGQGEPKAPAGSEAKVRGTAAGGCPRSVGGFVRSLEALRRQLAVGLSYEQYVAKVKALRASYDAIPVERLAIDCLAGTGTPSERALNEHVDAANVWGECLADASCTTATIELVLQRKWRVASRYLSAAR